jgi:hypothetical protein
MDERARIVSHTLYPDHIEAIANYARKLGLRGPHTRSPALQAMIDKFLEYENREAATSNGQGTAQ